MESTTPDIQQDEALSDYERFHAELVQALQGEDEAALASVLSEARAADIAESFDVLSGESRSRLLFALPPATAASVIVMLDEALRSDVVENLEPSAISEYVSELPPDDAADFLAEFSDEEQDEILGRMGAEQSEKLEELLEYEEETAGGIMTPNVVAVSSEATVADAVEQVRAAEPDDELNEIYIVGPDRKLVGYVPLRRLVTAAPGTKLADIVHTDTVTVQVDDDQEAVVQIIRKYDTSEAAVVDEDNRLLGRITHDDVLDVAADEADEDAYRMAGTDAAELETSSVLGAATVRLKWLLPCMVGTLITATVLLMSEEKFEPALFGALAAFAPMIGAMGGNSGIQISTIIVRGFATGEMGSRRFSKAFVREGRIAVAMAPVCGVFAWTLATVGFGALGSIGLISVADHHRGTIALSIGFAMTCAILVAGILAIALPFLFDKLGVDPAIASGPLVTTANDVVSVSLYMLLALAIAT